jgi:hypothetical protein
MPARGQEPHNAEFDTPYRDEVAGALLTIPAGYRLCSGANSYSSLSWYYIPLDKTVRCEQLPELVDWDHMPDFTVIGPDSDAAMRYERTSDYVAGEPFFCHGISHDPPKPDTVSAAPTAIVPAGQVLAGLESTICTRDDISRDLHTKAFLAYRPRRDLIGYGYQIGVHVRMANKAKADKLLDEMVGAFKLLD